MVLTSATETLRQALSIALGVIFNLAMIYWIWEGMRRLME